LENRFRRETRISVVRPYKKNGHNKDTDNSTMIKIQIKEAYGMTQKKMVQPSTGRHQKEATDVLFIGLYKTKIIQEEKEYFISGIVEICLYTFTLGSQTKYIYIKNSVCAFSYGGSAPFVLSPLNIKLKMPLHSNVNCMKIFTHPKYCGVPSESRNI
jgi:hypothetical protein